MPPILREFRALGLLACALLLKSPLPAVAQAQPAAVLTDDVGAEFWSGVVSRAFGPGGVVALAEADRVSVWSTSSRRLLASLTLTPDPPSGGGALPTRIQQVGFTLDGRLVLGTSRGLEVVSLRDTRQRQVVTMGAVQVRVIEPTADGVVVGFATGDVVRFGGSPLTEQTRFRLPADAARVGSIALAGDRTFVASAGRLFVHAGGAVEEVPMGGTGAHRDLAVGAGRSGEIVVAGGSHLARVSAQTHAVLANATSEPGLTYPLTVQCSASSALCYWRRGVRVEVWRDDLSERVAAGDTNGAVDAATGRALRQAPPTGTSVVGTPGWMEVADSIEGPWQPLGARIAAVSDAAWSSRPGELILGVDGHAHALRLPDLTLTPIGDTRAPVAVGSDGRVLTTGPLGEVIVHGATLEVQRTIVPSTCNAARIRQLTGVDTESAWAQLTRLERQCQDGAPGRLAPSPTGTLVAMNTANGDLRWLDYARGRWLERVADFAGRGQDTDVAALTWASGTDTVAALVGTRRYTVSRAGAVSSEAEESNPRSAAPRPVAGGSPALSASIVDGRLLLRRQADGAELSLTFVVAQPAPRVIARAGERFWAPAEVRHLVHRQVSPFDALAPELPSESALDPQLVTTFVAEAR